MITAILSDELPMQLAARQVSNLPKKKAIPKVVVGVTGPRVRPMVPVIAKGEIYLADAKTGALFVPATGKCVSSPMLRIDHSIDPATVPEAKVYNGSFNPSAKPTGRPRKGAELDLSEPEDDE